MPYLNYNGAIIQQGPGESDPLSHLKQPVLLETMLMRNHSIPLWNYHWTRLQEGMRVLGIDEPPGLQTSLLEALGAIAEANAAQHLGKLRLQLWMESNVPAFLLESSPLEHSVLEWASGGLRLGISQGVTKNIDGLANLKVRRQTFYQAAAEEIKKRRLDDILLLNAGGRIIESSIANVFWVHNDLVHTPPLSEGCVAGIMRRFLLSQAPGSGFTLRETPLTLEGLMTADEVFLTNAVRGVRGVSRVESTVYGARLSEQLHAFCTAFIL